MNLANYGRDIFESFFNTARHPAFILDLNTNPQKAQPTILNPIASSLFSSCKNFFEESLLEKYGGSLQDFILAVRRRAAEEIKHLDLLHVLVRSEYEAAETTFSLNAWSFDFDKDTKMLGVLLTEITKTIKEELNALEVFKESLTSALSHELNNPMNSLIPLLKMMPSCYSEEGAEDIKEMALASANLLNNKIRDLIDYSKIQQERIKLNLIEFYVEDLFSDVKRIFKYEVEEKSNVLITKIRTQHNKKLFILSDRNRIEQVLVKLVSNANKFTEKGTIWLIAEENEKNFNVIFRVEDTGIGMSKERLAILFAPLPQKARNLETVVRLPGLGLEIAKDLCQYMECKLNVVSEEKKGSKFFFEIPVCRIALFDEISVADFPETVKSREAPAMLLTNKEIKRSLFSKGFITNLEKTKSNLETKRIRRRLSLNGSIVKVSSSFRIPTNYIASQPLRRIKFPRFSQKNVMNYRNFQAGSSSTAIEWEITEESPDTHNIMTEYKHPIFSHIHAKEEVKKIVAKQFAVVIVDDSSINRFVIRKMLKSFPVNTIESKNGLEAVNVVEHSFKSSCERKIVLIFMDLSMPIMNGIDSTTAIRELEKKYERSEEIPIVAVTGQDATSDRNKCFEVGIQEYIKKPISKEMIKKVIEQYAPDLINNR